MESLTEEEIQELHSAASITIGKVFTILCQSRHTHDVSDIWLILILVSEEPNILESSQNGLPKVEATINLEGMSSFLNDTNILYTILIPKDSYRLFIWTCNSFPTNKNFHGIIIQESIQSYIKSRQLVLHIHLWCLIWIWSLNRVPQFKFSPLFYQLFSGICWIPELFGKKLLMKKKPCVFLFCDQFFFRIILGYFLMLLRFCIHSCCGKELNTS